MSFAGPYAFARVQGCVLQPAAGAARRPYVPKGSRVHISVTATAVKRGDDASRSVRQLGVSRPLGRDRSGAKDCGGSNGNRDEGGDLATGDSDAASVALTELITTDSCDGTRLTRRTASVGDGDDYVLWESVALPSAQRIGCIQLDPESRAAMFRASTEAAVFPSPLLYVSDILGNVYAVTLPEASVSSNDGEAPTKRLRHEAGNEDVLWRPIASAWTSTDSCTPGARGWCGLATLPSRQLLSCREFFFDLRLLDVFTGSVVRRYGTTHPATGMTACAGLPHGVVVAEGPLATVYDVRCSGAALALQKDTSGEFPLVTSRLTSPAAGVADVCTTCKEYEVVLAVGRSLCVHDVRKWNCLSVSTNTLKYDIGSIAPFAMGKAAIVAGIDAEVRIVPLQKSAAASSRKKGGDVSNGNANDDEEREKEPAATSFRNRIRSHVYCQSTWNGGWVESVDGVCASGLSADHEIFLSF